jgi:hypothetical protein
LKQRLVAITLLALCLLVVGCGAPDFDDNLNAIVGPYHFNYVKWEFRAFAYETRQWLVSENLEDPSQTVLDYFELVRQIRVLEWQIAVDETGDSAGLEADLAELEAERAALVGSVELILAGQITEVLNEQGIYNPWDEGIIGFRVTFPPVNFIMGKLPYLLVISPRDHIESFREIQLRGNLTLEEIEAIEADADALGVSSLVVALGGAGALYPTLVTDETSLSSTIEIAAEEWLHQYLSLKPLGFRYVLDLLGLHRDYEIATMNETLAGIVSEEIGALVLAEYYPDYETAPPPTEDGFDFNAEMRAIRLAVDEYLAAGEIELAEAFMAAKQQYLLSEGYYIRKLNQAYFAFHGAYGAAPTSVSPIGAEMRALRAESESLKDFLNTVAAMTSHGELAEMVSGPE